MSLGPPIIGTATPWYSQYDSSITELLTRLQDNADNSILAKDVRDPIWTIYNQILMVASQSLTQSSLYTLGTPSTIGVGGIGLGSTFSDATLNNLFDKLLIPYTKPSILFKSSAVKYQFGQTTPFNLSYDVTLGSVPIFSKNFVGPYLPISSDPATGYNPDIGTKSSIVPTFSSVVSLQQYNIFTMSVVTTDTLSFSATCSLVYQHKRYYGAITIPMGFTYSDPSSVLAVQTYLSDSRIKGLSYSELSTDTNNISEVINFNNKYFVFAAPTLFGFDYPNGFYIDNIFSQAFYKIKSAATFSNEYSYLAPYDVWISTNTFYDTLKVSSKSEITYTPVVLSGGSQGPQGPQGAVGGGGSQGLQQTLDIGNTFSGFLYAVDNVGIGGTGTNGGGVVSYGIGLGDLDGSPGMLFQYDSSHLNQQIILSESFGSQMIMSTMDQNSGFQNYLSISTSSTNLVIGPSGSLQTRLAISEGNIYLNDYPNTRNDGVSTNYLFTDGFGVLQSGPITNLTQNNRVYYVGLTQSRGLLFDYLPAGLYMISAYIDILSIAGGTMSLCLSYSDGFGGSTQSLYQTSGSVIMDSPIPYFFQSFSVEVAGGSSISIFTSGNPVGINYLTSAAAIRIM